jgi:CHAD domain-containing protein
LGELGTVLGTARDWDVLGTETLPRALAAYGDPKVRRTVLAAVTRRRRAERESARAAIRSRASAAVILELARWLPLEEEAPGADAAAGSLLDFAVKRIRKRHKLLLADAANLEKLTLAERHQVRIDTKRLRYKVDALASLFPEKRLERYLEVLGGLQDALGHANDATTAGRLLAELDPPEPFAAFARGWFAAQAAGDPMVFGLLRDNLADAPRFWRHAAQG